MATWATIPADQKDADGAWYGDYYGVLSFEVNKDIVKTSPTDWSDLLGADFRNTVALAGDPRTSNQAIQAVYAAGVSKGGTDAAKTGQAGLDFFAALNMAGNFVPTIGKVASLAQGATPIIVRWDYNALADRDTLKGNPAVDVIVPKTGVVPASMSRRSAPSRRTRIAAKLWMEYIYSDEGQVGYLKGYCHPIRFEDIVKSNKAPADLMSKLPPAEAYTKAVFPTLADQKTANEAITKQWDKVVGANVK